ncbi:hypothetical protein, partial [Staphylococcus aureus]|uniref:hypothetical protein n=1 Tax=Staphylococcus aureus TaxID=1280 RepID=UPI001E3DB302
NEIYNDVTHAAELMAKGWKVEQSYAVPAGWRFIASDETKPRKLESAWERQQLLDKIERYNLSCSEEALRDTSKDVR